MVVAAGGLSYRTSRAPVSLATLLLSCLNIIIFSPAIDISLVARYYSCGCKGVARRQSPLTLTEDILCVIIDHLLSEV